MNGLKVLQPVLYCGQIKSLYYVPLRINFISEADTKENEYYTIKRKFDDNAVLKVIGSRPDSVILCIRQYYVNIHWI